MNCSFGKSFGYSLAMHALFVLLGVVFVTTDPAQIAFMDSYAASTVRLERVAPKSSFQAEPIKPELIHQNRFQQTLAAPRLASLKKVSLTKPAPAPKQRPISQKAMASFSGQASGAAGEAKLARASLLNAPKPPYPDRARSAHFEGEVVVSVEIGKSGKVTNAKVVRSSGRKDCDRSALSTIQRYWRFTPAKKAGIPIPSKEKIIVEYSLS